MREIVLDTETTGLRADRGDRIIEVACVELVNRIETGQWFQRYVNPERAVSPEAFKVHGLSDGFLKDHPLFRDIAEDLLAFIQDSPLIIHNAEFDLGFLNAELDRLGRPPLESARATDTMWLARRRFPGAQANLDALCRRFEIDTSARTVHGALLDCRLLAQVYLELTGGRQPGFDLDQAAARPGEAAQLNRPPRVPRPHRPSDAELSAHTELLTKIKDPIWRQ